jgi:hypothetical protein
MTSVPVRYRTNTPAFYTPLANLESLIFAYNPNTGAVPFTNATWASTGSPYCSSVRSAGAGVLRDIGKQVISSGRVFRKVQLVVRQTGAAPSTTASTFGVAGAISATAANQDYLTGYIELGFEGTGPATPVAQYGTL